jgi:hypothetical protein
MHIWEVFKNTSKCKHVEPIYDLDGDEDAICKKNKAGGNLHCWGPNYSHCLGYEPTEEETHV